MKNKKFLGLGALVFALAVSSQVETPPTSDGNFKRYTPVVSSVEMIPSNKVEKSAEQLAEGRAAMSERIARTKAMIAGNALESVKKNLLQ